MKKSFSKILILLGFSILLISCGQTLDYELEKEYLIFQRGGDNSMNVILHYKGSPYSGTIVYKYPSGKIEKKESFKEGKNDGFWEYFDENGKSKGKITYTEGVEDGIFEEYHGNGQLRAKGSFKMGIPDGVFEYYSLDGKLEGKEVYKDGELDSTN